MLFSILESWLQYELWGVHIYSDSFEKENATSSGIQGQGYSMFRQSRL